MSHDERLDQLVKICKHYGANQEQAETMAAQLLKRSSQLAQERNITEIEAMGYLLGLLKSGREGVAPPQFPPEKGSSEVKK